MLLRTNCPAGYYLLNGKNFHCNHYASMIDLEHLVLTHASTPVPVYCPGAAIIITIMALLTRKVFAWTLFSATFFTGPLFWKKRRCSSKTWQTVRDLNSKTIHRTQDGSSDLVPLALREWLWNLSTVASVSVYLSRSSFVDFGCTYTENEVSTTHYCWQ